MCAASFAELSREGAGRFIQTVLVIDNELSLERETDPPLPPEVYEPANSLKSATRIPPTAVSSPAAVPAPSRKAADLSPLDAKQIMDAFLKRSMICGMHKPTAGDDLVSEAIQAARRSDAVIIDWMLEPSDPSAAKAIIAGILDGDRDENGRLRLIAVYTSEPDIADVVRQVRDHLQAYTFQDGGTGVLTKPNTRIVVLNKEDTTGATSAAEVRIGDLPSRIVEEFAHLASGILSTFAVSAIAAVRRDTHHMLAVFSQDLDGAFLGHMCSLLSPEDAREFALDLLAGELRSVASMNADTTAILASENLALRIDALAKDGYLRMGDTRVPLAIAREFPGKGLEAVKASKPKQMDAKGQAPSNAAAVNGTNVGFLFDDGELAESAHRRFARFASFRTESHGRTVLPADWRPTLSLGSLIVRRRVDGGADPDGWLLCTQPRCDAVRIEKSRGFPFQNVTVSPGPKADIIAAVPSAAGGIEDVQLIVGAKPHEARMIAFTQNGGERVRATRGVDGKFEFVDDDSVAYIWIGDLRDLAAQRAASRVAARMHEVGIDEFEWLRQKSALKAPEKVQAKPAAAPAK